MNIKGFKLTSGEEIVCHSIQSNSIGFIVEHPLLVEWEIGPNGATMYDLMPWAYCAKLGQTITIPLFSVCAGPYDVRDNVTTTYQALIEKYLVENEIEQHSKQQSTLFVPRRVSKRKG